MSDYIDRAALGIGLCTRDVFENKGYADGWNAAVKILKEAPAVDVQKIKHGKWIKDNDSFQPDDYYCVYFDYTCSECGKIVNDRYKLPNYCPNCGAKMDGGAK